MKGGGFARRREDSKEGGERGFNAEFAAGRGEGRKRGGFDHRDTELGRGKEAEKE